ncbi:hypothetical protein H8E88_14780 [candidate division KSB1 bacterium]|nr:hypothetical protein [candidate division KSB1 bacterium]MBL7095510.1 hypothetical protein [candidate division KSB1 bacterium]
MINKPNLIKGIPTLIVRALPVPYYYGRYAGQNIPSQAESIFKTYINYLSEALKQMSELLGNEHCTSLKTKVDQLAKVNPSEVEAEIVEITRNLSEICTQNKSKIKEGYEGENGLKKSFVELFRDVVDTTKVLIINNSDDTDWVEGLKTKLTKNCYYDVEISQTKAQNFSDLMVKSDVIVFASATPQTIHEEIKFLSTYRKPGLVLGSLQKDEKLDQQTMRNGSWLRSRGIDVLFKIFSPMRLFTTIDKINMRFLLQGK